jgi:hypothetical protein
MHSDRYVHPEFGFLSPTPRLRRELRMAFFSVLFGIGIGAAAVIALNGNNNLDEPRASHEMSSASVKSEQLTETASGHNSPQATRIENEVDKEPTRKQAGPTAGINSENHKTNATTTCKGNNSSCLNVPSPDGKPRGLRMPAANDALAIGRAPIGRPDASAGTTSAAPSASSERPSEHSTAGGSESRTREPSDSNGLRPTKPARHQNRARQDAPYYREDRTASQFGRGYDRPVREVGRAYSLDRSFGQKGFWDWSR